MPCANLFMNETDTEITRELDTAEKQNLTAPGSIESDSENTPEFFPVAEGKLITLYILSFGLYGVYWFYKNWKLQQPKMDKKISPSLRAIFSIFFTHALFRRINERAGNLEQKHKFNANALATLFVGAVIISNLFDRVSMNTGIIAGMTNSTVIISSVIIFILSAYPLVTVQATVNRINNDMLGYLNHKYSIWNYLLITLGAISWLMFGMGLLAESMGLAATQ